jgi:hypothetical protein
MKLGLMLAAAALAQGDPEPRAELEREETAPASAASSAVIAYPAGFFADFRPNNAFDMLQRLPGFTFSGGAEVRGFAGAVGNVLIDGERPSSKSVSLEDVLRRLQASSVERIDLIRGGAPGIDMQGQPQVANVIRAKGALGATAVTAGARLLTGGWTAPQADLEWTRRYGAVSLEGALHAIWEQDAESGDGAQTVTDPAGRALETGPFRHRERGPTLSANGAAELARGADTWRLNGGVERQVEDTRQTIGARDATGRDLGSFDLTEMRKDRSLEIGGDYEHTFSDALSAKVLALQTLGRGSSLERSVEGGDVESALEQTKTGESIVRASLTAQRSAALTVEAGGEAAFNFLEADNSVAENGVAIPLPNANTRVEERRAEGFVTGFWKPSERLSLEAGARVEVSRIGQSGDTTLTRSFFFPKPRAVLTYNPDTDSQVRLRVQREVGQLDFGAFAASAELGAGVVNAGNPDLEPERSWVFEAAFERRFWGRGAAVLTLTHAEIGQAMDVIPVAGRFDAPGNIGSGTRDQVRLTVTVPLDRLGVSGGLVTGEANWRWSRVTDPVTGRGRRISNERPFDGLVRFSQDVRRLRSTWGVDGEFGFTETEYRIDRITRVSFETWWTAYWDWKPRPGTSIRAEVQNLTGRDFKRRRTFFDGPRSLGLIEAVERRNARFDPFVYLRVRTAL